MLSNAAATFKARRNPRPCDACSRRGVRCRPAPSSVHVSSCQKCVEYGERCTFDRPLGRRGARPKHERVQRNIRELNHPSAPPPEQSVSIGNDGAWEPSLVPTQASVMDLAEVFLAIVYPVFPLFHRQTLIKRASRAEHLSHRPFYASLMAMCALALARVRDGALLQGPWPAPYLLGDDSHLTSEALFDAARAAIPAEAPMTQESDYMRASALLAITAIQYGDVDLMRYYLNLYHTFVAVGALHDESNWPNELTAVQLEERRRLYWSTYTLDVFTAIIWEGTVRSREATSKVSYPSLLDEDVPLRTRLHESTQTAGTTWLTGWNFVTDLYRILEHAADDFGRLQTGTHRPPAIAPLLEGMTLSQRTVLEHVSATYTALPEYLRKTRPPTGDATEDLPSFQAANITATVQLVRMVYLTNDLSVTLEHKCEVASEVILGFKCIPLGYLKAISVPLLHHLGGIGSILGATFEQGMTESAYNRIRSVLLELAQLLADLEGGLLCTSGTSEKLQLLVVRIDEYMASHRLRTLQQATVQKTGQSDSNDPGILQALDSDALTMADGDSPEYLFPPDLFEDWSWALNLLPDDRC